MPVFCIFFNFLDDDENESGNDEEGGSNDNGGGSGSGGVTDEAEKKSEKPEKEVKPENDIKPNSTTNKAILENPNIDNPYLRAATLPKRTKPDPLAAVSL